MYEQKGSQGYAAHIYDRDLTVRRLKMHIKRRMKTLERKKNISMFYEILGKQQTKRNMMFWTYVTPFLFDLYHMLQ